MKYICSKRKGWSSLSSDNVDLDDDNDGGDEQRHREDEQEEIRLWRKDDSDDEVMVDPNFFDPDYTLAVATAKTKVWDGSDYLADCLGRSFSTETNENDHDILKLHDIILELGSGLGYIGLLLAQKGHHVLLTDVPLVVEDVLDRNVLENATTPTLDSNDLCCWEGAVGVGKGSAATVPLNWTKDAHEQLGESHWALLATSNRPITIIASECVWLKNLVDPFCETVHTLLMQASSSAAASGNAAPESNALISFVDRSSGGAERSSDGTFLSLPMLVYCINQHQCTSEILMERDRHKLLMVTLRTNKTSG